MFCQKNGDGGYSKQEIKLHYLLPSHIAWRDWPAPLDGVSRSYTHCKSQSFQKELNFHHRVAL